VAQIVVDETIGGCGIADAQKIASAPSVAQDPLDAVSGPNRRRCRTLLDTFGRDFFHAVFLR
jgi:hypothetical protein